MQVKTLLRLSVLAAVVAIVMKTLAWRLTGSVGLLSDAMESFVNLASALFALAMVTIAARPADDDHPFGHTKAEYFSSGFEGLLIAGAAVAIGWAATLRFMAPEPLHGIGVGIALAVASSTINGALAWKMMAASRQHRSIALEADARHLYADVWTSAGIVVGLALVWLTGWLWLDPAIAMLVAANIVREGARVVWRSVDGLMDKALEPEVQARIDSTLARFAESSIRFDDLVTRRAGSRHFLDMHMHVPASWTLGRAAALRGEVEAALMNEVEGLRASIQLLPSNLEPHFKTVTGAS
ncbi:MAG: cation diffusion facilitator family transporter [Pseudomonadota bacterium]|nr:cation diffusion facilitator family transporter [Pseudomonadota bacterium]